jgi:hypothetical protein
MTIKYVTAKDAADLNKIQAKAVSAINNGRVQVQIALVATAIHAAKHGDWTPAEQFVVALGNSVNGAAVVEWIVKYMGLSVREDGKGFEAWQGKDYIAQHLDDAKDVMWWELKKKNPFAGFNAEAELLRFTEKYERMSKTLKGLSEEDQKKVSLAISPKIFSALFNLVNFEELPLSEVDKQAVADIKDELKAA